MVKSLSVMARESRRATRLVFVIKLLVSLVLVGWLLRMVGLKALAGDMFRIGPAAFGLAVSVTLLQMVVGAVRWQRIVAVTGGDMRLGRALSAFFVGAFYNCFLPSSVGGDVVRAWRARRDGLTLASAVNSVILDRIAALLGLLAVILAMSAPLQHLLGPSFYVFPLLGVGAVAGVGLITALGRLPLGLRRFRIVSALSRLSGDCEAVFLMPVACVEVGVLSATAAVLLGLSVYPLALGMGLHVSGFDCVMLTLPVILVTILPISIGGWGLREASFVFAFSFVGVPASSAITLSIAFGICNLLSALPGCIVWLADGLSTSHDIAEATGEPLDGVIPLEAQA